MNDYDIEINNLKSTISSLEARVALLEGKNDNVSDASSFFQQNPAPSAVSSQPIRKSIKQDINYESLLGGNWLVKIGAAALVLGVGFFLKLAFDTGWIGPIGQVIIGMAVGFILLFTGEYFQKKYTTYAQILTGGGVAILYVSSYAAYGFYALINTYLAFGFMTLVTAASGLLSIRYNKPSVALLGIMGGFATPFIFLKTLPDYLLIAYVCVLDYGIIFLSSIKKWRILILVGMIGSYIVYFYWLQNLTTELNIVTKETILAIIFLIFALSSIIWHLIWQKSAEDSDITVITLNAAIFYGISYVNFIQGYRDYLGFFTFLLALFYAMLAYGALLRSKTDANLSLFLSGISVVFLTLTMPIQLKMHWITIAWVTEAAVLIWLGFYINSFYYRVFGLIIYILVSTRLIFIDSMINSSIRYVPFVNYQFFTFLFAVLSLYAAVYLYSVNRSAVVRDDEKSVGSGLLVAANFFSLWALTSEALHFYSQQMVTYALQHPTGTEEYYSNSSNILNQRNFVVSFLWMIYSIGLIVIGFLKKLKILRLLGLILFWITILKVFLFDVFQIGGTWRVASFVCLGVILLFTGYLYQRFSRKFKELLITSIFLIIAFIPSVRAYADFKITDWAFKKDILVTNLPKKELVEVAFDSQILNKSSKDLHDLRIINQNGEEIPYKLLIANGSKTEKWFEGKILNNSFIPGEITTFIVDVGSSGNLSNQINIQLAAQNFRRQVTIEGSDDAKLWRVIKEDGIIYDYSDPNAGLYARNTILPYPSSTYRFMRISIKGEQIKISGVKVKYEEQAMSQTNSYKVHIVNNFIDTSKKATVIILDLGYSGLPNNSLNLQTSDTNFERDVILEGGNDATNWNQIDEHNVIFSLQTPKFSGESLSINYPENIYRYLRITVLNRDNKPLNINNVSVSGVVRKLAFEASPANHYNLFYGYPAAAYPQYDIERYFKYLTTENVQTVTLGTEVKNTQFVEKIPPPLPLTERLPWLVSTVIGIAIIVLGFFIINLIKTTNKKFPGARIRK